MTQQVRFGPCPASSNKEQIRHIYRQLQHHRARQTIGCHQGSGESMVERLSLAGKVLSEYLGSSFVAMRCMPNSRNRVQTTELCETGS